jgi:hypothetical protein
MCAASSWRQGLVGFFEHGNHLVCKKYVISWLSEQISGPEAEFALWSQSCRLFSLYFIKQHLKFFWQVTWMLMRYIVHTQEFINSATFEKFYSSLNFIWSRYCTEPIQTKIKFIRQFLLHVTTPHWIEILHHRWNVQMVLPSQWFVVYTVSKEAVKIQSIA